MKNLTRISLDTNILIFGLRKIDSDAELLLQNLFQFDVRICEQVERELWNNFADWELKLFYEQAELLPYFSIVYQMPAEISLKKYQMMGLKLGDAKIAAFCEEEGIDFFITENRHFLQYLTERSFKIVDCKTFCDTFSLKQD